MSTQDAVETAIWVTAAREGDTQAQDALVTAYLPLVYNIVGRALNGSVDVDDVVQETLLRALDGLGGLRTPERFRSWLVAIAMNQVRAYWHSRRSAPGAMEEAEDLADPGADFADLTVVQLQLTGQRRETARATRWLEADDRGLLSLWWLECAGELTRAEVAAALDLTPQHTAVRVQRMKAQLEAARVVVRALDARPLCEELRVVLASWDGRPSALWRKRIARHARGCVRCGGLWSGLIPADGLLAGLALVAASPALLAKASAWSVGSDPVGSAGSLTGVGGRTGSDSGTGGRGVRVTAGSRRRSRVRRRRRRRALVAAIVGTGVAGGSLWFFGTDSGTGGESSSAGRRTPAPVVDLATPGNEGVSLSATPSPSASPPEPKETRSAKAPSPTPHKNASTGRQPGHPVPPRTTHAPSAPTGVVDQVVALANKERTAAGCSPLTGDPQLQNAAQSHSDDMAARHFFDHSNPDGADPGQRITAAGYRWSTYGENIARGQQTATAVMESWMNSPGHRANILNCSFKNIGVGVHNGAGGPWWTQDFGTEQ
ncbi:sigma-70 family RNA polymerase sigma factor [Streptomyces sp. RS10V-4]|uniref:sigma-70 family RNA polymerase sigma factor n=1 Tax=Streptomyces rhizoryzae TaxID=2932493 RepID=UPI002003FB32|nr:sigma-70 family RNA polymerase sigma factor [Streptomyces rhizoryzae]MCK7622449.1 sigma-70 family RNA polymerase sigma factor [Streptomyces rhizoryzae]